MRRSFAPLLPHPVALAARRGALRPRLGEAEGELLPRGWERMNAMEKVTQVLYGKRGFLFWLNWLDLNIKSSHL